MMTMISQGEDTDYWADIDEKLARVAQIVGTTDPDTVGDLLDRMWAGQMTSSDPDACDPHPYTPNAQGYAVLRVRGRLERVHRLQYRVIVGEVPDGLVLDHTCHSDDEGCPGGDLDPHRRCRNVRHMEPVTPRENTRRGRNSHRAKTHCPAGHEYKTHVRTYRCSDGYTRRFCTSCPTERKSA